jgi:Co/Zn/Cd efflux system component
MFLLEVSASFFAQSVSLQADSIDFLGDAANYGVSLLVLGHTLKWRARASQLKAASMAAFGAWVIGTAIYNAVVSSNPHAATMGAMGLLALAVNVGVAIMLFRHRNGDSNAQSVWLCSRNDAIGNIAVIAAAGGVFISGTMWPDLLVAFLIGGLGLQSSFAVFKAAKQELKAPACQ